MLMVQVLEEDRLRKSHGYGSDCAIVRIGRSAGSDVLLDHPSVSRHHAEIVREEGAFILRDCGSSNRTFLNGVECKEEYLLDGDKIRVGRYILRVGITSSDEPRNPLLDHIYDYPTVRVTDPDGLDRA